MTSNPLENLLHKLGVSYDQLNEEERNTYRSWREALSGRQITDNEVRHFLESEKDKSVVKLTNKNLREREDIFLKMKIEFIISVIEFLDLPKKEKEIIETQIKTHN